MMKTPTAEVLKHLHELYEFAVQCAKDYESTGESALPDEEYDALLHQLRRMVRVNRLDPHCFPVAFEAVVGAGPTPARERGNKLRHAHPMYSLKKIYEIKDFSRWLSGVIARITKDKLLDDGIESNVSIEYKLDGHAVQLVYIYGKLCTVVTRGDGEFGDDITARAIKIPDLPKVLKSPDVDKLPLVVVDGEIYSTKNGLDAWSMDPDSSGLKIPKDTRAMVSTFRGESAKGIEKHMSFNPHQLTEIKFRSNWDYGDLNILESHRDRLELLRLWGFRRVTPISYARNDLAATLQMLIDEVSVSREQLDFPIDGIVVAFDSVTIRRLMGYTQDDPKWAIALKFPAVEQTTRVVDIEWNVSMNGNITPTLMHFPVKIGNRRFSRVSLHNYAYVKALGGLCRDQQISVALRGDVTPVFMGCGNRAALTPLTVPVTCPSCKSLLIETGVHLKCNNLACMEQMTKRLVYYSKDGFAGIRGWNEQSFKQLLTGIEDPSSPFEVYRYLVESPKRISNGPTLTSAALVRLRAELQSSLQRDFIQLFSGAVSGLLTNKELKWVNETFNDWEQLLDGLTKPPPSDLAHQVFEKLKPINKDLRLIGAAVATKGVGLTERFASILL